MENQRTPISSLMATAGAVTAVFSLVLTALILSNALRFSRAEDLRPEQLPAVQDVLHILAKEAIERDDAMKTDDILLKAGLDSIPGVEEDL